MHPGVTATPCTFQQQWLWTLLQRHPDWRCMVSYAYRLSGSLNDPLLQRSLDVVLRRHGSLRTRIVMLDEMPTLQIAAPGTYRLASIPISGASREQTDEAARNWVEEISTRRTDPLLGPLLTIGLLQLADTEHWLVIAMHRLIGDCAAIDQVFRETWLEYTALALNRPSPFTGVPPQYDAYAIGQRESDPQWQNRHKEYWSARLDGATSIRWPVDSRASETTPGKLGRMNVLFGDDLSAQLRDLARRLRTLLANVMLTVYVAVLSNWCSQNDFVVPVFVAGRQSEHKSIIGYFSHILYLRMQLTGRETFSELLNRVSNEFFRALSHQDFGRMAVQSPELLAGVFFQWVTWHPEDVSEPARPDPSLPAVQRVTLTDFGEDLTAIPPGMVAVEVSFFDTPNGVYASGVYRSDMFSRDTMQRFITELRRASQCFVENPDAQFATAKSQTMTVLTQLWSELLEVETIGPDDNFFELGGQSPLAMRLLSEVAERLGTRLPFTAIFQYPTIREMAQCLETYQAAEGL
jgi:acyl carrier protein